MSSTTTSAPEPRSHGHPKPSAGRTAATATTCLAPCWIHFPVPAPHSPSPTCARPRRHRHRPRRPATATCTWRRRGENAPASYCSGMRPQMAGQLGLFGVTPWPCHRCAAPGGAQPVQRGLARRSTWPLSYATFLTRLRSPCTASACRWAPMATSCVASPVGPPGGVWRARRVPGAPTRCSGSSSTRPSWPCSHRRPIRTTSPTTSAWRPGWTGCGSPCPRSWSTNRQHGGSSNERCAVALYQRLDPTTNPFRLLLEANGHGSGHRDKDGLIIIDWSEERDHADEPRSRDSPWPGDGRQLPRWPRPVNRAC